VGTTASTTADTTPDDGPGGAPATAPNASGATAADEPPAGVASPGTGTLPWWVGALRGLSRFPLYLVTLAYGPTVGIAAAALFAGFESSTLLPGWPEAILALELAVLGWLAIYPSPRQSRLAGPFNALLAYALAWGTAGLALLEARTGAVTMGGVWQQHRDTALGIVLSAVLLVLVSPATYRSVFPASRIAPRADPAPVGRSLVLTVVEERPERVDVTLTHPDLPRAFRRRQRRRALEPLPELPSDVDD
jgi:hypothetical protein